MRRIEGGGGSWLSRSALFLLFHKGNGVVAKGFIDRLHSTEESSECLTRQKSRRWRLSRVHVGLGVKWEIFQEEREERGSAGARCRDYKGDASPKG